MINAELSRAFERIADLLEIDGEKVFRINSYRRAARTLKNLTDDVEALAKEGRLTELPGIGKGTASRIEQFIAEGKIDVLEQLQAKLPEGLPALLEIQGMVPKKVALVHNDLGVKNLDDLKRVIESGEMAKLPGLGATSVKRIAEGIEFLDKSQGRTPMGVAMPIAEALVERIANLPGVKRAVVAGSLRRGSETVGDVDLLCDADNGESIVKQFTQFEHVQRVLVCGSTKGSVTVSVGNRRELQVDLRVVPAESFGAALQYFTGSKEHNVRLREIAVKKKLRLNEWGLFEGEESIAGCDEDEIYRKLGVSWVPPELREDWGEFNAECLFEDLVGLEDIRGDLHMHTTASDGKCSIAEMAEAAKSLGYEYIAICDHSKSSTIANGLSIDRMKKHIDDIKIANDKTHGITILVGTECDILTDGSLDYPDDLLAQCDWVVASIHSAMGPGGRTKASPTQRTVAALKNPWVSAIGHPTGRLIPRRAPMDMDMDRIIKVAKETHTLLEVNASWQRLDLKDIHIRQAVGSGVGLVINTDAHATQQLEMMRYGVTTSRRGGAGKSDVVNCLSLCELRTRIEKTRCCS